MQITFRFTDAEYKASRRLNQMLGVPKWKSYGLAVVCLIPSLLLVWISGSTISLIAFALMISVVAVLSFVSAVRESPYADKFDHVMTFSETSKHERLSDSEFETDWSNYDEFSETETSFIFRKLERYALIPKRVIPADQVDEFRRYAAKVNQAPDLSAAPVPLFEKLFSQPSRDGRSTIYRFAYHPDDLARAIANPLTVVNETTQPEPKKRNNFGPVWLALFVVLLVYFVLVPPNEIPWNGPWNLSQLGVLIVAIGLPFLFIRGINSWFRSRAKKRTNSVPRDENQMRLMSEGWAIGSPQSVIFYDWRDIECFYENVDCIGFKTINDLIQIIPKRIFSGPLEAQTFLAQAIGLRREHRRKFEDNLRAVETGNPYQPPAI